MPGPPPAPTARCGVPSSLLCPGTGVGRGLFEHGTPRRVVPMADWEAMRDSTQARLLPSVSKTKATALAGEEEVQGAFWYQGRKSLWEEVVCRGDAFCSAGEMSCTVTPIHCHLRVIMMGTWEAGSLGKPHSGHWVHFPPVLNNHPEAWLGVSLGDTDLGAAALQISTSRPSWSPSRFLSQSWWLHPCLVGLLCLLLP